MIVALQKTRLPNGLPVYHLNQTNTEMVYQEIFVEEQYRRYGITYEKGDCIFDIGANIGLFQIFLNQVCVGARVLAVEPIPKVFEVLERNIDLCERLNTTALNIGLSRSSGSTSFTYYPRLSCASTMYPDESTEEVQRGREYVLQRFRQHPNRLLASGLKCMPSLLRNMLAERVRRFYRKQTKVTCELRTISQLIAEYSIDTIHLLKIDTERSEIDILKGIDESDWPIIRQAIVETHDGDDQMNEARDILSAHGFTVHAERSEEFPNIYMLYAVR